MKTALERQVDFVALSGDVFHDFKPSVAARVAFRTGLDALHQAEIPVFMALGNHDPLLSFPASFSSLPGLHVFPGNPHALSIKGTEHDSGIMIYGISFEQAAVTENLVGKFRRDSMVDLAIGVIHTNVSGSVGHKDYAPCTLNDLRDSGMDVWCLGHVHSARELCQSPLTLYSGVSQGANIGESGPKGCWIVTVDGPERTTAEFVRLATVQWEPVVVEADGLSNPEDLIPVVETACAKLVSHCDGLEAAVVSLTLTGERSKWSSVPLDSNGEIMEMLSERLALLPVPVCPAWLGDARTLPLDLSTLMDDDGYLGDFLRLCRLAAQEPAVIEGLCRDMRVELMRRVSRPHVDALLEPLRAGGPDERLDRLLDDAAKLAASVFFELADRKD